MIRFDAVLWDLDGTLVETRRDIATAVNLLLADRQLPPMSVDAITAHVGRGSRFLVTRCLYTRGSGPIDAAQVERAYEAFRGYYLDHLLDTSVPYPGVLELLERLRVAGVVMGIVSNKPEDLGRRLIDGLGMARFFAELLGGDSLPERKPDPAPLLHLRRRLCGGVCRALMVGDMPVDLEAARAAGIPAAAVGWGFGSKQDLLSASPDLFAESPAALGEWILG